VAQWGDYTTGQRVKLLRGTELTQERLADAAGLSVATIRKLEGGGSVGLPSLLLISAALHTDVAVILGQQAPRQSMSGSDRAMLRELSRAVHDTAARIHADLEPPEPTVLARNLTTAWDTYRDGQFVRAGQLAAPAILQTAAALHAASSDEVCTARGIMADAYRLASYVANQFGARDLAYAAIGHAQMQAEQAQDPVRVAMVASGRSWIYLRDSRLVQAQETAEASYLLIEPRYADRDPALLAAYGWHVVFAAVVAARMTDTSAAADLLSQGQAVAARMGRDVMVNGTAFGPAAVTAQAVGISVSTGQPGKALELATSMTGLSSLTQAARNRFKLDVALAQVDTRQWDASLDTLLEVCSAHPDWARHQALPGVIMQRAHAGHATTSRVRKLAAILGTSVIVR